ncbi:MAG: translation initiation factor IF-2 [Clostridia bacterium]|nr:translation initiation factor IF-2 [Clostridia bacterium]
MAVLKYKIHEAAKDFGKKSNEIIDLLAQFSDEPKKYQTVLTPTDLDIIFDVFTQQTAMDDLSEYFNMPAPEGADKAGEAAAEPTEAESAQPEEPTQEKAAKGKKPAGEKVPAQPKPQQGAKPGAAKPGAPKPGQKPAAKPDDKKKKDQPYIQARTKGEKKTVDTRGGYVELDKYNEKYENIAGDTSRRSDRDTGKQKIKQKSRQDKRAGGRQGKRETEQEKLKRIAEARAKQQIKVTIGDEIQVSELASQLKLKVTEVIKKLMGLGVMAAQNQVIDFDTAAIVAEELGAKVEREVIVTIEDRIIDTHEDREEELSLRDPVVCVMGHVDHGKTSLLDAIRHTSVTATESGGITQHIGASRVHVQDRDITFLDTPGHAAFTAMRARGAMATDIAILVVAADDGIMPQTIEAISHAKAAGIAIVVAVNKIDKPGANPERIKQQLTEHGLVPEEWGGDVICVNVSAKTGEGLDELLESVLLVADMLELKANADRAAKGVVIEARLDKGRGPVATLLVQNGTLKTGDIVVAGTAVGRIRVMTDDKGGRVKSAGPSIPVEITGLADTPQAGDTFDAVSDEKLARELVEQRQQADKEKRLNASANRVTLDNLFSTIAAGEVKDLNIVVKADVQGSVEAVSQNLEKLTNEEVRVKVIHGGVGAVTESDVMLADASNAIIVGFHVRPEPSAVVYAERMSVDMHMYNVIYDCIEDIEAAIKGMLAPKFRDVDIGRAEVRNVFKLSTYGTIAGSYVQDGKVTKNCKIRVVRDGIVIFEDTISSLRRFKDDVKEVVSGYECGIGLEKFNDIKERDVLEAFITEEYKEG